MNLRWRKAFFSIAVIASLFGLFRIGLPLWQVRRANRGQLRNPLPIMSAPTKQARMLVLAPHCDDETLACGGEIALAVKAGAAVEVVILTNGDGFRYGAERLFREMDVTPEDYRKMAAARQKESLAALAKLGVPAKAVIFLGYPDGGTAQMWQRYWSPKNPYLSPKTKDNHNPYANSLRPGAPYCGRAVIDDLKKVITDFKPTILFAAHPNDNHCDHWASNCYVLAALYELGKLDQIDLRLYLVHRGDWPLPQGLNQNRPLSPPASLNGMGYIWKTLPLAAPMEQLKKQALFCYKSQLLVMRRFLFSFIRKNELFCQHRISRIPMVTAGKITVDGKGDDWQGIAPDITDPSQDQVMVDFSPGGDLMRIYTVREEKRLFMRVDLWKPAAANLTYLVQLHPLLEKEVAPPREYAFQLNKPLPAKTEFRGSGRPLELSVPWGADWKGVMLCVSTWNKGQILDKTAWALLKN